MFAAVPDSLTWLLVAGMAAARGLDLFSTWVVTPQLELEANPLMRHARWRTLVLVNLPLLGLPFVHAGIAVTFIVASLLVAGTNLANGALARGMGEKRQIENQMQALRRIGLPGALAMNSAGMAIVIAAGALLMTLAGGPGRLVFWGALGVLMCGVAGLFHLNWAIVRLHRRAQRREAERKAAQREALRRDGQRRREVPPPPHPAEPGGTFAFRPSGSAQPGARRKRGG